MTTFQRWIIALIIIISLIIIYFWRTDVSYNRCQKAEENQKTYTKFINPFISLPEECQK